MRILLLGSGGREHAFAWKLAQSPHCEKLFIAPGNAGTNSIGINLKFSVTDFEAVKNCCLKEKIDLLIVGPEEPLVKGIVDFLKSDELLNELLIIGPSKEGAHLEGSKTFSKQFMIRNNIPTASYQEFTNDSYDFGISYLQNHSLPIVLKADGLAAGKGVVICQNHEEAIVEFTEMLQNKKFGEASNKVVVEEFLTGIEVSVFVLTDGKNYVILPEAKDYKRIGEGDTGQNTGGMGAISPVPFADEVFMKKVVERIINPTIGGLQIENIDYSGFIFFGLIKVKDEPFVIEYNCRMGDPETEVVIPRLKNDLVKLLTAAAKQQLHKVSIEIDQRFAATVVAVSEGYPGNYNTGIPISGIEHNNISESICFHSGTIMKEDQILTNGGRVLCVTSFGNSINEAVTKSKIELQKISYDGMYYRNDIGYEFE